MSTLGKSQGEMGLQLIVFKSKIIQEIQGLVGPVQADDGDTTSLSSSSVLSELEARVEADKYFLPFELAFSILFFSVTTHRVFLTFMSIMIATLQLQIADQRPLKTWSRPRSLRTWRHPATAAAIPSKESLQVLTLPTSSPSRLSCSLVTCIHLR